ncbi:MAG: MFS transporter [bacterium]
MRGSGFSFSRNAWLFLLSNGLGFLGYAIFLLLLNLYLAKSGLSKEVIAWVNAAISLAGGLLALPLSALYDRMPRKIALFSFTLLQGLFTFLLLFFQEPLLLVGSAFLIGASFTVYMVLASPFMMENTSPEQRIALFSTNYGILYITGLAGNAVGGFLPSWLGGFLGLAGELEGLRAGLAVAAILFSLAAIPFLFLKSYHHQRLPSGKTPESRLRFPKSAWMFLLAMLIISLGAGSFVPFLNLFFSGRQFSTGEIGLVFTLGSAVNVVMTPLAPLLARWLGKIRGVIGTLLASIPFLVSLAFVRQPALLIGAFISRQAMVNLGQPLLDQYSMELVPEAGRARFAALLTSIRTLAWAFTAPLAGLVMQRFGFSWLFLGAAGLYLIGCLILWRFCARN